MPGPRRFPADFDEISGSAGDKLMVFDADGNTTGKIDWADLPFGEVALDPFDTSDTVGAMTPVKVYEAMPREDIRYHGASPLNSPADNDAAIQAAIDEANGQRIVWIPDGEIDIASDRHGAFDSVFTYPPNTRIEGAGPNAKLTVADDFTDGGDYRIFAPAAAEDSGDVRFERFTIDGNGANNLVLGSSGGNIRRGYMIYVDEADSVVIDGMHFLNSPGRNVLVLGNNGSSPSIDEGTVTGCTFSNVGGGISGNHLQNDHSACYTMFRVGEVRDNKFKNPAAIDPASPATRVVTALEIHGSGTLVTGNTVRNFTHGGNAVAAVMDSVGNQWVDNRFYGLTKLGINIWTLDGKLHQGVKISRNHFEVDPQFNSFLAGIYQSPLSASTSDPVHDFEAIANSIYTTDTTVRTVAWHGIYLTAIDGGKVNQNQIRNPSGAGIILDGHTEEALHVADLSIDDNQIINAGYHSTANRIWGILLLNASTVGASFRRIHGRRNVVTKPTAAGQGRGLSVQGAGLIEDVSIDVDRFSNIANITHIAALTGTNMRGVSVPPKVRRSTTAASPTSGIWLVGDRVDHSDVAASGTVGKVTTTAGAASEAVWATATAYTVGQWIRTSGNKVLECTVAGTSDATTEPNPSTLGAAVTDGTVTWAYRSSALAVFKTYGTVAA